MEIIWSNEALKNYLKVIDYLFENWTIKEIKRFEYNFNRLIANLKDHVGICPKSKILNLRKCVIDENNSLIYQEINNIIFLVTIIDNRSFHSY
ncbi:type II toxin-antitoxin system RelE/ParE family toxin [Chryseobacterium nepalense]|uniref:Type II toxin-antitoxin system RelE/ParE family toxin n=1 Tax=Chryseobacterium nepalense TaxID=1854498 RepID=A0ABY4K9B2_9FLAO|nr:type II toxin-antitoxin system RelE/ParE family toxin [Chryseobacterium nepalense]UPQ77376.1 type II toxin-antitoxin system RelE/ParE family toxin [Chryseobacterium nepalense]